MIVSISLSLALSSSASVSFCVHGAIYFLKFFFTFFRLPFSEPVFMKSILYI